MYILDRGDDHPRRLLHLSPTSWTQRIQDRLTGTLGFPHMVQASLNHRRRGKGQSRWTIPMSLPHVVGPLRWTRSRLAFSTTVLGNVYYVDDRQYYPQNAPAKDISPPAQMFGFRLSSSTRSHRTPASRLLSSSTGDWDMQSVSRKHGRKPSKFLKSDLRRVQ